MSNASEMSKRNLDDLEGCLALNLGSGWLSRFEAAGLNEGDVVIGNLMAGNPATLSFNGAFLAEAEVVVMDPPAGHPGPALFGARLIALAPEHGRPVQPERGLEATELLPFAIRIGEIKLSLAELEGAGRGTIIGLDAEVDGPDDAELVLAGQVFGRGKVVVAGENLGLRLSRLNVQLRRPRTEIRTTGACILADEAPAMVKDYDFRRPDCVTRPVIERLSAIHQEYLRSLQMILPRTRGLRLASADQLTFGEWIAAKEASECTFRVLETEPSPGARGSEGHEATLPGRLSIRPLSSRHPAIPAFSEDAMRRHVVAGGSKSSRGLCFLSLPPAVETLIDSDEAREQNRSCLRNGWKRFADFRFRELGCHAPGWKPSELLAYCGEHDMILMAIFTLENAGQTAWMEVIYPLSTLRPHLGLFQD